MRPVRIFCFNSKTKQVGGYDVVASTADATFKSIARVEFYLLAGQAEPSHVFESHPESASKLKWDAKTATLAGHLKLRSVFAAKLCSVRIHLALVQGKLTVKWPDISGAANPGKWAGPDTELIGTLRTPKVNPTNGFPVLDAVTTAHGPGGAPTTLSPVWRSRYQVENDPPKFEVAAALAPRFEVEFVGKHLSYEEHLHPASTRAAQPADMSRTLGRRRRILIVGPVTGPTVAHLWNEDVALRLREHVRALRAGRGLSVVGELKLHDDARYVLGFELLADEAWPNMPGAGIVSQRLAFVREVAPKEGAVPTKAGVTLSSFTDYHGEPPCVRLLHKPPTATKDNYLTVPPLEAELPEWRPQFVIAEYATGEGTEKGTANPVRVGSLDLEFATAHDAGLLPPQRRYEIELNRGFSWGVTGAPSIAFRPDLDVAIAAERLPLLDVRPGGCDPLPDEYRAARTTRTVEGQPTIDLEASIDRNLRRPRPVVIDITPSGGQRNQEVRAALRATEIFRPSRDRSLSLEIESRLKATGPISGTYRVAVVDPSPFSVARIEGPALWSPTEHAEIANWSISELDGEKWEVVGGLLGFRLTLPPQTVGEEMVKGGGWPMPKKGAAIDYRFGTAAVIHAKSSFFSQRFAEAPWNVRRVMGYPGQRAPGVGVVSMRVELLYGMTAAVDAVEVPFALRLSELSARLGNFAAPISYLAMDALHPGSPSNARSHALAAHREQFARELAVLNRRPAAYELYNPGESLLDAMPGAQRRASGDLNLEHGLKFFLRGKLAEPAAVPCDSAYPILPDRRVEATLPDEFNDGLFKGGATFGFESDRAMREVWRNRTSKRGHLGRVILTAFGGYGEQRALFANGKTIIYSDTECGRVSYYAVERIGRIGVLWNRARHVIVYRRSVLPSQQFDGEQGSDHDGRPILRKFEEFVELLEPERSYPERGEALRDPGFVLGSRFGTRKIPVHGSWSRDLASGWEIPLWRENADPEIYPKPVIKLKLAEAAGGQPYDATLGEPQHLYFYTSTRDEDTDDTDLWSPVVQVDFPRVPMPSEDPLSGLPPKVEVAGVERELKLPSVCPVPMGWQRQSFRLDPATKPTNLVAGRQDARLAAKLSVVTMQRGRRLVPAPAPVGEGDSAVAIVGVRARQMAIENVLSAIAREPTWTDETSKAEYKATVKGWLARMRQSEDLADSGRKAIEEGLAALDKTPRLGSPCDAISRLAFDSIDAFAQRSRQALIEKEEELLTIVEAWSAVPSKGEIKKHLGELVDAPLRDALNVAGRLKSPFSGLQQALQSANEALFQISVDATAKFDEQEKALLMHGNAALAAWRAYTAKVIEALRTASECIPSANGTPFHGVSEGLRTLLTDILKAIVARSRAVEAAISNPAAVKAALAAVRERVFTLGLYVLNERIATASFWLVSYVEEALAQPLGQAGDTLGSLHQHVRRGLDGVIDALPSAPLKGDVSSAIKRAFAAVHQTVAQGLDDVRSTALDPLEKLCDSFESEIAKGLTQAYKELKQLGKDAVEELLKTIDLTELDPEAWRSALEEHAGKYLDQFKGVVEGVDAVLDTIERVPLFNDPDEALRLIRAVGEGPILPGLKANAESIAYLVNDFDNAVRTSPLGVLVHEAGGALEAMGLRLPVRELADRLVPDALRDFDVSRILEDVAGLKELFRKLKMPDLSEHGIRVTHGFEPKDQRAWIRADLDLSLPKKSPVFDYGPLQLTLDSGRALAFADLRAEAGKAPVFMKEASVTGDWSLRIGGTPLVGFVQTKLAMSGDSSLSFDFKPENVRLDRALAWLNDVVKAYSDPDSGLYFELIGADEGRIDGLRVSLDLPVPPIGAGVVSISGLRLGARFELLVASTFSVGAGLSLGKKTEPFTLIIAFLGGGGWLDAYAKYTPKTGEIDADVTVGIVVAAGAAFAVPAVHGSVFVRIGIYLEYHVRKRGGGGLTVAVMFLLTGRAVVCGIATVDLTLLLQLIYGADRSLVGTGNLSITIRVSRFFKIKVARAVRYKLAGGSGGGSNSPQAMVRVAMNEYDWAIAQAKGELTYLEDFA